MAVEENIQTRKELELFGRYRLLEVIGSGGMAEVFLAKQEGIEGFERRLAIKRILPHYSKNESFVRMFVDEAKLVGHFTHPNIVQVFDFGIIDDSYYISMEYVDGVAIADILTAYKKAGMLVPQEVIIEIAIQACRGIDYAHKETDEEGRPLGIIHRDLTPHNILISKKGITKITDFGIAKASMNTHMTQAGMIKGKVPYMSPEQAMGHPLTQVSDIFTIGIVTFEMLALRRLFDGANDFTILRKVQQAKIPCIGESNPNVSEEFERILMKALSRDRTERYKSAGEMEMDLTRLKFSLSALFEDFSLGEFIRDFKENGVSADAQQASVDPNGMQVAKPKGLKLHFGGASTSDATAILRLDEDGVPVVPDGYGTDSHINDEEEQDGLPEEVLEFVLEDDEEDELETPLRGSTAYQGDSEEARVSGEKSTPEMVDSKSSNEPEFVPASVAPSGESERGSSDISTIPEAVSYEKKALGGAKADSNWEPPPRKVPKTRQGLLRYVGIAAAVLIIGLVILGQLAPGAGFIRVQSQPSDVDIYLNGKQVASRSPFVSGELTPEDVIEIEIRKEGFLPYSRTVTVQSGVELAIPVNLERLPQFGSLLVRSEPSGAAILLGEYRTDWRTPCRINLKPGVAYALSFALDGHETKHDIYTLGSGEEISLFVDFAEKGPPTRVISPDTSAAQGTVKGRAKVKRDSHGNAADSDDSGTDDDGSVGEDPKRTTDEVQDKRSEPGTSGEALQSGGGSDSLADRDTQEARDKRSPPAEQAESKSSSKPVLEGKATEAVLKPPTTDDAASRQADEDPVISPDDASGSVPTQAKGGAAAQLDSSTISVATATDSELTVIK